MLKQLTQTSLLLDLPIWSMLIFFVFFVAALFWALSRRRGKHFDSMAHLPLGGEEIQFSGQPKHVEDAR